MLEVTNTFKEKMRSYGKQIDVLLEFKNTALDKTKVIKTEYSINGELLTSIMKQISLEIEKYVSVNDLLTVKDVNEMLVGKLNNTKVKYLASSSEYNDDIVSATEINVKIGVKLEDNENYEYVNLRRICFI